MARIHHNVRWPADLEAWANAEAERQGTNFSAVAVEALEYRHARHVGRWRHKPTVIDAYLVADILASDDPPRWVWEAFERGDIRRENDGLYVISREDPYHAYPDWWLCRGVKDEIYAIPPEIHDANYEPAGEP